MVIVKHCLGDTDSHSVNSYNYLVDFYKRLLIEMIVCYDVSIFVAGQQVCRFTERRVTYGEM